MNWVLENLCICCAFLLVFWVLVGVKGFVINMAAVIYKFYQLG